MVFNIRPFAEEFLNTMARDFEIIIFTAGEQDVSNGFFVGLSGPVIAQKTVVSDLNLTVLRSCPAL